MAPLPPMRMGEMTPMKPSARSGKNPGWLPRVIDPAEVGSPARWCLWPSPCLPARGLRSGPQSPTQGVSSGGWGASRLEEERRSRWRGRGGPPGTHLGAGARARGSPEEAGQGPVIGGDQRRGGPNGPGRFFPFPRSSSCGLWVQNVPEGELVPRFGL